MAPSLSSTSTVLVAEQEAEAKTGQQNKKNLPSIEEIRAAIPEKCFEKSLPTSVAYLILDYAILTSLYLAVPYVELYAGWIGLLGWYWIMGMFLSSLFIIGHDCGHTTFSNYKWVNDLVGHLTHAPIMAPYWPWQKSHRSHHQYTSHIEKDKGHPWNTEEDWINGDWLSRNFSKLPFSGFLRWNPVYTIIGLPDGSHFWPYSRLFTNNTERLQCVVSGTSCLLFAYIAFYLCDYSVLSWLKYYYVPILFQGFWMVMITYLQHQDEEIEVFEEGNWSFVTGQSQTIDRYYGFGIDTAMHHITDAHHFFFTRIPHYHLMEATAAIQKVMQKYPGVYKRKSCYTFLYEFLRLNLTLEYLMGRGTGLLKYNASSEYKNSKKLQ